jgi:hypothetical protein
VVDRIRSCFIQAMNDNMGNGLLLMEVSVLAERDGKLQPFPCLVAFCAPLLGEGEGAGNGSVHLSTN